MSVMKTIAAVALAAALPTMAQAATFTLTGGSGTTATATFSAGGIGLDITANSGGADLDVHLNNSGVGVKTGWADLGGIGNGDFLTLTFSQAVTLNSLTLADWDMPDDLRLTWAGGERNLSGNGVVSVDTEHLTGVTGTVFTIAGASGATTFRLHSLDVTPVAAVPEPSTYALMGLGLVGIGFAARRRAAK